MICWKFLRKKTKLRSWYFSKFDINIWNIIIFLWCDVAYYFYKLLKNWMMHFANWSIKNVLRNHDNELNMKFLIFRIITIIFIILRNFLLTIYYLFFYLTRDFAFLLLLHFVVFFSFFWWLVWKVDWALRCSLNVFVFVVVIKLEIFCLRVSKIFTIVFYYFNYRYSYYVYYRIKKFLQNAWMTRMFQSMHLIFDVHLSTLKNVIFISIFTMIFWYYYFMNYWFYYYINVRIAAISLIEMIFHF